MISKQEIMEYAKKYSLDANIIEKDYILNWLLAGITISNALNNKWIFKGGTCLKKCYFEEYRFSEDLDFTITDPSHINKDFLTTEFSNISEWVYEQAGIEIPKNSLKFEEYVNPRGYISIEGKIAYKGPMQRRANNPTVKLNLCNDEVVAEVPIKKPIHHPYSDFDFGNLHIQTYSIEEILAEKLRALIERMSPRDLYDIVHLYTDDRWHPKRDHVLKILIKKCEYKEIDLPTMKIVDSLPSKQDLIADWNDMLAHQIANLENHEHYWDQLFSVFEWLYKK